MDFDCTYTAGKWHCPHTCQEPSHHNGRGRSLVFYKGRYYPPGALISTEEI